MILRREKPSAGLVVRFDYLWKREFDKGQDEGGKTRPCVVVVPMPNAKDGVTRVILAAITHSVPVQQEDAIEIPPTVKRALGLDQERSWIVVTEINIVDWNDAGFIPATPTTWSYGFCPNGWQPKSGTKY